MKRFVPFLADAIAIALGYTSHPNEDAEQPLVKQPQPRPVRMHGHCCRATARLLGGLDETIGETP